MIEVLKHMVEAMLWIEPCDRTKAIEDAIQAGRQAIAELEKQDVACQHCAEKGCVACDARKVAHDLL